MPRTVGGFAVHYHHQPEPLFPRVCARTRVIFPDSTQAPPIRDTTDYLNPNGLGPGVCVGSAPFTGEAGDTLSTASTAGILLGDGHGNERVTVASHAFLYDDSVFHPLHIGRRIGTINEQFRSLDIALVELEPSINFTNDHHFDTKRPTRLLRSTESQAGSWYAVDGISTGLVMMQDWGRSIQVVPRSTSGEIRRYIKWQIAHGDFADLAEGLCGGAIIGEGNGIDAGGVAGFFQLANAEFALSPCLDDLIADGWRVV